MAALDFPSSPTNGQTYTANGSTWTYNSATTSWLASSSGLSTTLTVPEGGTGQTTAAAAFNALSPLTTLGDLVYASAANTASRLAGNTTATKQFLSQTGTGTVSAAPAWSAVSKSDVGLGSVENTALSTWAGSANITTVGTVATGTWSATAIAVAKGGTGATDAATARTNLGLAIGTNVQAWDADLDAIAALAGTSGLLKKTAANTWSLDTSTYLTANQSISISGDASGSGTTSIALTLATVDVTKGGTGATTAAAALTNLGAVALAGSTMTGALGIDMAGNQLYLHAGSASSTPTVIHRNDGANYYILLSAAGTISGTWNALRPLLINLTTGGLTSQNGQTFTGGCSVDTLSIGGFAAIHVNNVNSYAPTLTGVGATGSWGISVTGSSASCTGNAATATYCNAGAQPDTWNDHNARLIRNSSPTATYADGMYIGYANTNSGLTRVFGGGSTTAWSQIDSTGYWVHSGGNPYIYNTYAADFTVRNHLIGANRIELCANDTGNRFSYIDFHGDDTYTDFSLRLLRGNGGANAASELSHRGTGALTINAADAGSVILATAATTRLTIDSGGTSTFTGLIVGKATSAAFVSANDTGSISVRGDATYGATISFHRPFVYGVNFGLDTDNVLKVGGWSMGAVAYPILHSGNSTSYASSNGWKLWARFSGTTIYASSGMTSFTVRSGTAYYANFAITLADVNYCVQFTINEGDTYTTRYAGIVGGQATTNCTVYGYGFAPCGAIVVFR